MPREQTENSAPRDRTIRRIVFFSLISIVLLAVTLSFSVEEGLSYAHGQASSGDTALTGGESLRHGTYGFYLARLPRQRDNRARIVLLGNSVYQALDIVPRIQRLSAAEGHPVRFVNLALTGSSIYDFLLQAAKIASSHPDLLVISVLDHSFCDSYRRRKIPRFRTDSDQMLFDAEVVSRLPLSFYWREFNVSELASHALSAAFPLKRVDWLIRRHVDATVYDDWELLPTWTRRAFPLPILNVVLDWLQRTDAAGLQVSGDKRAYPNARLVFRELLQLLQAESIPVLLIRQEHGPRFQVAGLRAMIQEEAAGYGNVTFIDLQDHFTSDEMPDHVHPRGDAAKQHYAQRHFRAIVDTFNTNRKPRSSPAERSPPTTDQEPDSGL